MSTILDAVLSETSKFADREFTESSGRVVRYDGLVLESSGFPACLGAICEVDVLGGDTVRGEIIGFRDSRNMLFLDRPGARIEVGARVRKVSNGGMVRVGPELLGRVIDADGLPLDTGPEVAPQDKWPLAGHTMNPLARQPVDTPLDVGVRVINATLTVGRGQRIGIIAGSGVGKSVLIEMMTHFTDAEIIVIGLIGERAREVGEFVTEVMTKGDASRVCVVAVPADRSPLLRLRAAFRATAIAEYFRAEGKQVLLIMDSLTRVAHAQRELGLALGEQPTAKGYPPSVISLIPTLVERTGPGLEGEGSITAIYTVLADGDDTNDPVVDSARAIMDGHIILSRQQAQMGIYPAIDIPHSISRVMSGITDKRHAKAAQRLRNLVSLYMENRDLMLMGGYVAGQDLDLDKAISIWPQIVEFVSQAADESADFKGSVDRLLKLTGE